jgi:ADP-heptose:LPS heptosyltransferase
MSRWQFRRYPNEVISFTDALAKTDHALIILPLTPTTQSPAPVIEFVRSRFPEDHITLVAEEHDTGSTVMVPHGVHVRLSARNVDWMFRPSSDILGRVTAQTYDLAVDLNLDFLLPSAYICRASNARVRVGFVRERADLFYNFQMQPDGAQRGALYERLAACLKMF